MQALLKNIALALSIWLLSFDVCGQCTNYTINVTAGSWPSEVSWNLVNSSSVVVSSGLAPANVVLCLPAGCYTLNLIDAFGDGWNGAVLNITGPGSTVVVSTTLTDGLSSSQIVSLGGTNCCPAGTSPYNLNITAGNFPSENSWEIIDGSGTTVTSGGTPTTNGLCLAPGCYSILMYDMFGDGWDGSQYTFSEGATVLSTGTLITGDFGLQDISVGGVSCTPVCSGSDVAYHLVVTSDLFPDEVSWTINDENGVGVSSGSAPASAYFCVHPGCYEIVMNDAFGDGWFGAVYTLYDETGATVQSGSLDFGFTETNTLQMDGADCGISTPVTASDCNVAVNVCDNLNFQIDPNGAGLINEIPAPGSFGNPLYNWADGVNSPWGSDNYGCLRSGELNSTWMTINIWQGGMLNFTFGGVGSQNGFYDWIMYPYNPATTCQNVLNNVQAPVRCNWNLASTGGTGLASVLPAGANAGNFEPPLSVITGEQYLICFSNWSSVTTAVPLDFGGTAVVGCGALILPVHLLSFDVTQQNESAELLWETDSEINNDYFQIEYSSDGIQWTSIGMVDGFGTTNDRKTYRYIHDTPQKGLNYYRLRQFDYNGNSLLSSEESLRFIGTDNTLYPNPNDGRFYLNTKSAVVITDVTGRRKDFVSTLVSENLHEIRLTNPVPGVYLVRTLGNTGKYRMIVR